ncbi:hypothetical protein CY652_21860 [Burkholderia sp. WAC0059]|uniref:HrpB1 family type III secretion system apparatus protein n=1 Tax=Burkholderia sp. WAC0059 TaxID=2066022 RepID=UPI000C7EF3B0|nr:HrpB1 family type III secretion system apparatus protein [Burkholderia sp. WAC0059]PLZ00291.1 hypothetical protein CY652_21860 [Burkholderia sp. WAC0059]
MTDLQKTYQACPKEVVDGLVEIVSVALRARSPVGHAIDPDLVEQLVEALHALRPHCAELGFFDALLQVARKNWRDAIDMFRGLIARSVYVAQSRSMLVYCMNHCGDSEWRFEADALLQEGAPESATTIVQSLIARADLAQAVDLLRSTGAFAMPESVYAAQAMADGQALSARPAKPASAPVSTASMLMRYGLRI